MAKIGLQPTHFEEMTDNAAKAEQLFVEIYVPYYVGMLTAYRHIVLKLAKLSVKNCTPRVGG